MITTICTELTLPNDAQCLRMARGYVESYLRAVAPVR